MAGGRGGWEKLRLMQGVEGVELEVGRGGPRHTEINMTNSIDFLISTVCDCVRKRDFSSANHRTSLTFNVLNIELLTCHIRQFFKNARLQRLILFRGVFFCALQLWNR